MNDAWTQLNGAPKEAVSSVLRCRDETAGAEIAKPNCDPIRRGLAHLRQVVSRDYRPPLSVHPARDVDQQKLRAMRRADFDADLLVDMGHVSD
ncbi:MAG: hypothetical protein ACR2PM_11780 [Hyphomicrobiales bacterium]